MLFSRVFVIREQGGWVGCHVVVPTANLHIRPETSLQVRHPVRVRKSDAASAGTLYIGQASPTSQPVANFLSGSSSYQKEHDTDRYRTHTFRHSFYNFHRAGHSSTSLTVEENFTATTTTKKIDTDANQDRRHACAPAWDPPDPTAICRRRRGRGGCRPSSAA